MEIKWLTKLFNTAAPQEISPIPLGSPISLNRAVEIFDQLADMEDIAFGYTEGCYARAHIMCRRLMEMGLTPQKAWAFEGKKRLLVDLPDIGEGWWSHVAPTLLVRTPDGSAK